MEENTVRRELLKVAYLLENGVSELTKMTKGLRDLIETIDAVLMKVELEDDEYHASGAGECFYQWLNHDINENFTPVMTEQHWQAYASQDWFAGFKSFPRGDCKLGQSSTFQSCANSSASFYGQVAEVLVQIEQTLRSLENKTLSLDENSMEFVPVRCREECLSDFMYKEQRCSSGKQTLALLDRIHKPKTFPKEIIPENHRRNSVDSLNYYVLCPDFLGDYEDKLDDVLENIIGENWEDENIRTLSVESSANTSQSVSPEVLPSLLSENIASKDANVEDALANNLHSFELESYFD